MALGFLDHLLVLLHLVLFLVALGKLNGYGVLEELLLNPS